VNLCLGVTVGYEGVPSLGGQSTEEAKILRSTDFGLTWSQTDSGTTKDLTAIHCFDAQTCAIVGTPDILMVTRNGGIAWTVGARGTLARDYSDVACPNATTCIAVGSFGSGGGAIMVNKDAGPRWVIKYLGYAQAPWLRAITCPTETVCIAVGDGDAIVRTADGGAQWQPVPNAPPVTFRDIDCIAMDKCVAMTAAGIVYVSRDGGLSWTQETPAVQGTFGSLRCLKDEPYCWIFGINGSVVELRVP